MGEMDADAMTQQERIEALIESIINKVELDNTDQKWLVNELCKVYSDVDFRHSYYKISLLLEKYTPDQRDVLCNHFHVIGESVDVLGADEYEHLSSDIKKNIRLNMNKLCDHIDLECLRLSRIAKVEYIGNEARKDVNAADGKLQTVAENADELEKRVSGYHAQSISILGIFAGVVVTFSGIIQFTTLSFSNLTNVSAQNVILFAGTTSFFLFNIVFLLMYCISKIAGKSIASKCKNGNCEFCKACKCMILGRLRKKYPFVFWFDAVSIVLLAALFYFM